MKPLNELPPLLRELELWRNANNLSMSDVSAMLHRSPCYYPNSMNALGESNRAELEDLAKTLGLGVDSTV